MAYEYKPFRYRSSEIRLLILLPSSDQNAVVHCELETVSLTDNPYYVALSYCWADPPDPKIIRLHDHDAEVTGNLYAALVSLRDEREPTRWWIDALSINQNDVEERSPQVLRMTSIYSIAHFVAAWIGPETPGQPSLHQYLNSTEQLLCCDSQNSPGIGHFRDLLSRKYWRRMWIVQEISVAAEVRVVCGSSSVPWDKICKIMNQYERIERNKLHKSISVTDDFTLGERRCQRQPMFARVPETSNTAYVTASQSDSTWTKEDLTESYRGLQTFRDFRLLAVKRTPIGFVEALKKTSAFLSTDDRDRFYALSGLTYDGLSFISIPDYKISFDNLQVQMANNILQATRNIEIIIARGDGPFLNGNMPSWTPDWLNLGIEANYVFTRSPKRKFRAAGDSTFTPSTDQQDPKCIQTEGLVFERLDGLSTVYGELNLADDEQTSLHQSVINTYQIPPAESKRFPWLGFYKKPSELILELCYCLSSGLDLVPLPSRDQDGIELYTQINLGMMWFYCGIDTSSENDWWYKRFVARFQAKRQFDSPELSKWLQDNCDLLIRGQSFQSVCKSDFNVWFFSIIWSKVTLLTTLMYLITVVSIGGFIGWARTSDGYRLWLIVGCSGLIPMGLIMVIYHFRIAWTQSNTAHRLRNGFLKKMDKYMKQRRLRLATTGGGPGNATGWGGLPAVVPGSARRGDCVAILKGCSMPVLLREYGDGYQVIGSVYLEKAMHGELMKWPLASWKVCKLY